MPDSLAELAKSRMRLAIEAAQDERADDLESIEIQVKPRRGVFATAGFAKGAIKLVPLTTNVGLAENEEKSLRQPRP